MKLTRALSCPVAAGFVLAALSAWAGGEVAHEKPSPLKAMAEGDIADRINYLGSIALYSTWLTLQRVAGKARANYAIETAFAAIPQPRSLTQTKSWDVIWNRLERDGFLDLPGNHAGKESIRPVADRKWKPIGYWAALAGLMSI